MAPEKNVWITTKHGSWVGGTSLFRHQRPLSIGTFCDGQGMQGQEVRTMHKQMHKLGHPMRKVRKASWPRAKRLPGSKKDEKCSKIQKRFESRVNTLATNFGAFFAILLEWPWYINLEYERGYRYLCVCILCTDMYCIYV